MCRGSVETSLGQEENVTWGLATISGTLVLFWMIVALLVLPGAWAVGRGSGWAKASMGGFRLDY
jgi:hypothetical protein